MMVSVCPGSVRAQQRSYTGQGLSWGLFMSLTPTPTLPAPDCEAIQG